MNKALRTKEPVMAAIKMNTAWVAPYNGAFWRMAVVELKETLEVLQQKVDVEKLRCHEEFFASTLIGSRTVTRSGPCVP